MEFLYVIATLACFAVTVFAVPFLKRKLGAQRFAQLQQYARVAVQAAEQLLSDASGAEKLAYVQSTLRKAGFGEEAENRMVIESAVAEQKQGQRE